MKYFEYEEFDSPGVIGSGESNMNKGFLQMLDDARGKANTPFIINSGYRTFNHNQIVGGKFDSSHLKGQAADIKCVKSRERALMLKGLIDAGFNRIGISKTFIHVDNDEDKDPYVYWVY